MFEDLEYALRGPPLEGKSVAATAVATGALAISAADKSGDPSLSLAWNMSLVARAWDPRVTPASEFRGIVWGE